MKRHLFFVILGVLSLGACTSTRYLQSGSPDTLISGTVTKEVFGARRVEVTLNGKIYRGDWRVDPPTKEQKAETSYPHRRHIGIVDSKLLADDGSALVCHWKTESITAEGICQDNGREYLLNMK